jgi:hypothetical protein
MNEDVFPSGPLDKTVSFSPVEPLHSTLLSHNELLSPLLNLKFHILREARASLIPSKPVDELLLPCLRSSTWCNRKSSCDPRLPWDGREVPEPVVVTRVSTAIDKTSTRANERRCRYSGNGRNNIQEFSFWQEKNYKVKRLIMTRGLLWPDGELGLTGTIELSWYSGPFATL